MVFIIILEESKSEFNLFDCEEVKVSINVFINNVKIVVMNDDNYSLCNENGDVIVGYFEESYFNIEGFFSIIGVGFEIRGFVVVEKFEDLRIYLFDKGFNLDINENGES